MSDTPKIDALIIRGFEALRITKDEDEWISANVARQLERELEQVRASVKCLAWHKDGIGPDVPVLQERYDALVKRAKAAESQNTHLAKQLSESIDSELLALRNNEGLRKQISQLAAQVARASVYIQELIIACESPRESFVQEIDAFLANTPAMVYTAPSPPHDPYKALEVAREALTSLRMTHYTCEDCWYSCPKSGECCNELGEVECSCGADKHNNKIEEALNQINQVLGDKEGK